MNTPSILFVGALVLAQQARAQSNSTTAPVFESWRLSETTRSTWDILWTCLATVFTCTWTILHLDVPRRFQAETTVVLNKLKALLMAVLAPELIAWVAGQDLVRAKMTATLCNAAERRAYSEEGGLRVPLHRGAWELKGGHAPTEDLYPEQQTEWTVAHGFCINMRGLVLKTQDGWLYAVRHKNVESLIGAGLLKCADVTDREIKDRAKADSLAKALSVLQSMWVLCNIVARAAYRLPITPLEIATVAYVVCGVCVYAVWWHKPKDMATPIVVSIPYIRGSPDIPQETWNILNAGPEDWAHSRVIPSKLVVSGSQPIIVNTGTPRMGSFGPGMSFGMEMVMDHFTILFAELYCCIHIAAWNYSFPTQAEKSAWRVLSLIMVVLPMFLFAVLQGPAYMTLLSRKIKIPGVENYTSPEGCWTMAETVMINTTLITYLLGRVGVVVLLFTPLRALPVGSYVAIDWLAAVPHI